MGQDEVDGKHGKAKQHDPDFKGPIANRGCTDIICCLLFTAYVLGLFVLGVFAFINGNPSRLIYPTDSYGNLCGSGNMADKPYLLFFNIMECTKASGVFQFQCPTQQICVKSCPTTNMDGIRSPANETVCVYHVTASSPSSTDRTNQVRDGVCAPFYLKSTSQVRRCIPDVIQNSTSAVVDSTTGQTLKTPTGDPFSLSDIINGESGVAKFLNARVIGTAVVSDINNTWYLILGAVGVAMACSLVYILIMRWIAGPMVWLSMLGLVATLSYSGYYCFNQYSILNASNSSISFSFTTSIKEYGQMKETWLAGGITSAVVGGIILLILIFLRDRVSIAIELIEEASQAVRAMCSTIFFPLFSFLLQLATIAWWVGVELFLLSAGTKLYEVTLVPTSANSNYTAASVCNPANFSLSELSRGVICQFVNYAGANAYIYMQIYHLFGFLWVLNFVIALSHCTLAGAFASWYWAFNKPEDIPSAPLLGSLWRCFRYHIGSLAFGALIIAIVQLIRIIIEFLEKQLRAGPHDKANPIREFFFKVAIVDNVTAFLLFLGKLLIVGITGIASFYYFRNRSDLNYYLVPVIIIIVCAYVIASVFFGVYDMAVDTLFLCFLEDLERNDGSTEKPYFMSKDLKRIVHKENEKPKDEADNKAEMAEVA
ncbi:Choline transporter-like protein 2 [Trichoplax sp. H2]|nr:Choline transporter-like protein 2 [Trichoplax sp. H2]|eukprot:RDD45474.1 Choline transporter-like protein 2 [Trichoplax sp. H2]